MKIWISQHFRTFGATLAKLVRSPLASMLNVGVIGNCAYSALIDARGRAVWCCLPRFDGDPVFNDPGKREEVRKVYSRKDFLAAWEHSKRTSYVIYPESAGLGFPEIRFVSQSA